MTIGDQAPPRGTPDPAGPAQHDYRPDIDGLRAIAVLAVVGFHAFPDWVAGGFAGVDVFFVISGFLISGIIFSGLETDRFSFAGFYARRVKRIFPALTLVLVATGAAGWATLLPQEYMQLGKHIAGGAGFGSNFVLWNEAWDNAGYFDNAADTKPLLHLWSLGIEEQFYMVWPLLTFLAWKWRFNLRRVTLAIAALSFAINVVNVRIDLVGTFYSPLTRFWEILAGGILSAGVLYRRDWVAGMERGIDRVLGAMARRPVPSAQKWPLRDVMAALGLLLVVAALLALDKTRAFPGWWAALPTGGAWLLIAAGPRTWVNRHVLSQPPLVWIGLISFPLYLWHWPLLSFARIIEGETPAVAIRVAAMAASVALAQLTYWLIERPIRLGGHVKAKVATLCVLLAATGSAGWYVYHGDGLVSRFPANIVKLLYDQDPAAHWKANTRAGTCHLDVPDPNFSGCADRDRRPLIFFWGDSHAAVLYSGFRDLQQKRQFGIGQFTVDGCPPLLDVAFGGDAQCKAMNERAYALIKSSMPDVVILHAYWQQKGRGMYDERTGRFDASLLAGTVARLKALGIRKIIVLGPVPAWRDNLRRIIFTRFARDPLHRLPPVRLNADGLQAGVQPATRALAQFAREQGITFLSPLDVLCNAQGCLTRMGDHDIEIATIDYGHLSPVASAYLISGLAERIFEAVPQAAPN